MTDIIRIESFRSYFWGRDSEGDWDRTSDEYQITGGSLVGAVNWCLAKAREAHSFYTFYATYRPPRRSLVLLKLDGDDVPYLEILDKYPKEPDLEPVFFDSLNTGEVEGVDPTKITTEGVAQDFLIVFQDGTQTSRQGGIISMLRDLGTEEILRIHTIYAVGEDGFLVDLGPVLAGKF
ncbi:hypothetical protein [Actinocorallia aurea]